MLIDFRQLFPKYNIRPNGVLHVGANVGEEAPVYLELGIKHQVWIEANPIIYERLKNNLTNNPQAYAINACIGDVQGERVTFHVSNNGSQSSSILELGTHLQQHPEVHYIEDVAMETQRIDMLKFPSEGLDFLNIDLQGAELKALKGMGDLIKQFKWAYLEVNRAEVYKGCPLVEDIDFYLGAYGFTRVETKWCGNWGDAIFIKQ
jgi:FkbM family methyltransferase